MLPGIFLQRPNRFLARVALDEKEELCHVKNTGRLGELLLLLSNVWLNPMIYPATPEKTRRRMELYVQLLRSMGLDLLDQELLDQWEQFCRLSQERL